ncbi:hypothetical protein BJX61DRAFT_518883 [Aspergillus egyptiacus]|nr:hypothetical protein BJX61DRAFT_518883 [Aspergillus egyptiacus]
MDSPSSVRSSPSKALNPLSPERMNKQTLPNSPSSVSDTLRLHRKHNRGISDVQTKVAYLNGLSRGESPVSATGSSGTTSTGGPAAALQRAILGREEAESALSRVSSELAEAQSRERRISERLESLLEELQNAKERQARERIVFEKEIRKARKEAFRAGSILVQTQDELKQARSEAKDLKEEVQLEREAREKANQEAFERAHPTQDELEQVKSEVRALEKELQSERKAKEKASNEAYERSHAITRLTEELEELKVRLRKAELTNHAITLQRRREQELKKQEIGRMSLAEGDLALIMTPTPRKPKRAADDPDTCSASDPAENAVHQETPPKRPRLSTPAPVENEPAEPSRAEPEEVIPRRLRLSDPAPPQMEYDICPPRTIEEYIENLLDDICIERRARKAAEDTVEFMKVSCMFKWCDCRILEKREKQAREKKLAAQQAKARQEAEKELKDSGISCGENAREQAAEETSRTEAQRRAPANKAHIEEIQDRSQEEEYAQDQVVQAEAEDIHGRQEVFREGSIQEQVIQEEDIQEATGDDQLQEEQEEQDEEPVITFSPVTGTFRAIPSPARASPQKQRQDPIPFNLHPSAARSPSEYVDQPAHVSSASKYETHSRESLSKATPQSEAYSRKLTEYHHPQGIAEAQRQLDYADMDTIDPVAESHNVKRIPLRTDDNDSGSNRYSDAPGTPISREQALAQIRARRGRTSAMKRSVSANEAGFRAGGLNVTPVRAARRIPGVQHSDPRGDGIKKNRRDMSAPLRPLR